jgi:putative DNA primase/helicase
MKVSEAFPPERRVGFVASFGEAERIARALKGHPSGNGWVAKCPCHDDRKPSLSIKEGEDGRLLMNCFAGCGCEFTDIIDALRDRGIIGADKLGRGRRALTYVAPAPTEHKPNAQASWLWKDSVPLRGTPAQNYLERRGITIMPPSLRYHAGSSAMLAGIQRPDGKLVSVQSTFITARGEKAPVETPRMTRGELRDGAVRLAAAAEVMGLAEGTETGLSAMVMSRVPVWVSLGSKRMDGVVLPERVREVHIFGDNDQPGHDAAHRAADAHHRAGRRVVMRFPPTGVKDFNDLLLSHADRDGSAAA